MMVAASVLLTYLLPRQSRPPMVEHAGIHFRMPRNPPITVSFLGLDRQADGARTARFSMSNHTGKPVEYWEDASSRPRYDLWQLLGCSTNGGNVYFNITNHNSGGMRASRTLGPGAGVTCVVHIPPGVTNELVMLHYMPQRTLKDALANAVNRVLRAVGTGYSIGQRAEESYPLWEPFEGPAPR
jgi:hypothetical protein